ncbi:MAG: 3-deoxy-D-manno-octulosonic acid transferase, partial [Candidatus Omnitrophota bacterium]
MTIYDVFFFVFSLAYLPYLVIKGKAHSDFRERFGKLPRSFEGIGALRPIWVHAVSVGEVLAVKNFVEKLHAKLPERKIVLSTTTKTGADLARRVLNENILKFYFPLDFSFVARRVANFINPSLLVVMETEIWPNLILELSRRKIPIVLINGRISDRSFKGYKKIKFFFKDILKRVSLFLMRSEKDARYIKTLGAPGENVRVTGNMKFDIEKTSDGIARTKSDLGIGESEELLIAGSTHGGEEEIVLDVYSHLAKEFQNLRLLIAPRHIDRAKTIKKMVERMGLKNILVLDTFGELSRIYGLATIVFMGGSLVKRGGHNIVEPAVFGKPIVFGPYMFNFRDMARSFLENKAAIKVKNRKELLETLEMLLKDGNR